MKIQIIWGYVFRVRFTSVFTLHENLHISDCGIFYKLLRELFCYVYITETIDARAGGTGTISVKYSYISIKWAYFKTICFLFLQFIQPIPENL